MASSPGIDGMVDIRSYAIFQDVSFNKDECTEGAEVAAVRGPFFRRFTHTLPTGPNQGGQSDTVESSSQPPQGAMAATTSPSTAQHSSPFFTVEDADLVSPPKYDTQRSWLCCFCSVAVIFLIFGTIFSYAVLHRQIQLTYNLSSMESVVIGASCFSIFILVGPFATHVIKSLGFRSTAIFGMLLVFIGLLLEGFVSSVFIFYVSRLALIPIGGGFAHTASHYMSSFFEEQIKYAVLILCASSTLGILVYSWFTFTLQSIISYKGIHLIFAIIVLFLMTATHSFPMKLNKSENPHSTQAKQIKTCIKKNVRKEVLDRAGKSATEYNPDATAELKSCLCVCVCEIGTICNRGFFLWAGITMVATLTFLVPYLFLFLFQSSFSTKGPSNVPLKLISAFGVATLIARLYLIMYNNHTFLFNCSVFQIALAGTGILFLLFARVSTYGWLTVWMIGIGLCQGLISVTIPRVTLQTVPRQWLKRAWILIICVDALGSFIGPILLMMLRFAHFQTQFQLPTVVIGILQLATTLLTFLIPNDEKNYKNQQKEDAGQGPGPLPLPQQPQPPSPPILADNSPETNSKPAAVTSSEHPSMPPNDSGKKQSIPVTPSTKRQEPSTSSAFPSKNRKQSNPGRRDLTSSGSPLQSANPGSLTPGYDYNYRSNTYSARKQQSQ